MTTPITHKPDPKLDLVMERVIDVPPHLVWLAWTKPEHIVKWFTPAPWKTVACEIDLRPGGLFHTVMQSPEGQQFPSDGCYLEIVENRKLAWTNALLPGYRPAPEPPENKEHECSEFLFTAILLLEPHGGGTKYTAIAIHRSPEERDRHDKMGFEEGWGKALEQLVEVARTM